MATHDRTHAHTGVEDTTTTVLASAIGRYNAGMVLHDVLVDLEARLRFIEQNGSASLRIFSFPLNARILKPSSFTLDAFVHVGAVGSFTLDALIDGTVMRSFTLNALIIEDAVC